MQAREAVRPCRAAAAGAAAAAAVAAAEDEEKRGDEQGVLDVPDTSATREAADEQQFQQLLELEGQCRCFLPPPLLAATAASRPRPCLPRPRRRVHLPLHATTGGRKD